MTLQIGATSAGRPFALPLELTTQTVAILAKRGSGKTYTAAVCVEEMLDARQQVLIIDPTGAWWGLKSSANGEVAGYPIVVFGGDHGDLPLEEHAGEVIAGAAVASKFSAVLDLSLLRKAAASRFVCAFLEALYRLNREPVSLVVDEADAFAPQLQRGQDLPTLGAMEDTVRRGRKKGIGCMLITQRPAVLNKNVLTQCEMLVTLRLVHPKDIDAIEEWVNVHADPAAAKTMISSLPSLPIGTAWFWAPGWGDVFARVAVRRRRTFDSSATPKPGQVLKAPKKLASVDIEALGKEIADTAQRAREDDPKALRTRIADLERQVADLQKRPALDADVLGKARTEAAAEAFETVIKAVGKFCQSLRSAPPAPQPKPLMVPRAGIPDVRKVASSRPAAPPNGAPLPKAERRILSALAQYPLGRSKKQVAVLCGYAIGGGGFNNALGALRGKGFVEGREHLIATASGLQALGAYAPLPSGYQLAEHWYAQLPKAERSILASLVEAYPKALDKHALAAATGYEVSGGGFNNALGRLRTLELIAGRNELQASQDFFQ